MPVQCAVVAQTLPLRTIERLRSRAPCTTKPIASGTPSGAQLNGASTESLSRNLSDRILASPTATSALLAWCDERGLSSGPITIKRSGAAPVRPLEDECLDQLMPEPGEPITYRHVDLVRGSLVLSTADIWFMPHPLPRYGLGISEYRETLRCDHRSVTTEAADLLRTVFRSIQQRVRHPAVRTPRRRGRRRVSKSARRCYRTLFTRTRHYQRGGH
jgi:hypothetical protein